MSITDIFLIKTMNSIYEIQVNDEGSARCRKDCRSWHQVKADSPEYLERLVIGASFDVPGVVLTSIVKDYQHFVPSGEPKRTLTDANSTGIGEFFEGLTEHLVGRIKGNPC